MLRDFQSGPGMATIQNAARRLRTVPARRLAVPNGKEAAVLIALQDLDGEAHFLFTRRTETVATHKGQISFPGGVRERQDRDLVETALRETEEEIGVARDQIEVLGEFHDYLAVTDLLVRSVVGIVPGGVEFHLFPEEVAYVLQVPVRFFETTAPVVEQRLVRGQARDVYFFEFEGETIWGLTARIVVDFVDFLRDQREPGIA
jgi:8-oxo-dGTP pyrophosphatase MutT (NUDIX family)